MGPSQELTEASRMIEQKPLYTAITSIEKIEETLYRVKLQLNGDETVSLDVRFSPPRGGMSFPRGLDDVRRVFGFCPTAYRLAGLYAKLVYRGNSLRFPVDLGDISKLNI